MNKLLILSVLTPMFLYGNVETEINKKIDECKFIMEQIPQDTKNHLFMYYFFLGAQNAYIDCLKIVKEEGCH